MIGKRGLSEPDPPCVAVHWSVPSQEGYVDGVESGVGEFPKLDAAQVREVYGVHGGLGCGCRSGHIRGTPGHDLIARAKYNLQLHRLARRLQELEMAVYVECGMRA